MEEQPELFPDVIWLWNLFQLLSETRDYGFGGPLRIKLSELKALLDLRGIRRDDDVDLALRIIPVLDAIWLEADYKDREAKKDRDARRR